MIEHLSFIELEKFKFLRLYLAKFAALRGGFLVPSIGFDIILFYSATLFVTSGDLFLCFYKAVVGGMQKPFEAFFLIFLNVAAVAVKLGKFHLCPRPFAFVTRRIEYKHL